MHTMGNIAVSNVAGLESSIEDQQMTLAYKMSKRRRPELLDQMRLVAYLPLGGCALSAGKVAMDGEWAHALLIAVGGASVTLVLAITVTLTERLIDGPR